MKFVHAYVLCAFLVATQMKGAECQQLDEKQASIKGLTELIASIPQKTRWTKTGRQVDPLHTFVIFGSSEAESTPIVERPLSIYPFRQTHYNKNEAKTLIKSYGTAFKTHLNKLEEKETTKHFSSDRTLVEQEKCESSKSEAKKTDSFTFNPQTKQGYTTQVIVALKNAADDDVINTLKNELIYETQKNIAALSIRDKYLQTKINEAKQLEQNLAAYTPTLNNDFVCIINALIHDIQVHSSFGISSEQALQQLFTNESQFKKSQEKFNLLNKDGSELIPDFDQFNTCYGILPQAIAQYACIQHNNKGLFDRLFAKNEPALATDLKAANNRLLDAQDAQQKEELLQYIANLRASLYASLIQNIRSITSTEPVRYAAIKNDSQRLVYAQTYIAQAKEDTLAEEQKIAEQLQHILPKDIAPEKAIETVMGWPKSRQQDATVMAARLAKALV